MPIVNSQGGGAAAVAPEDLLTDDYRDILEHWTFNPEFNSLDSDVSLRTSLNTFWLSNQWGISSGNRSLFFRSADQEVDFSPILSGIKKQIDPANRDSTGIVEPFYRKPSDDLIQAELRGVAAATGSTPYAGSTTATSNLSVHAVRSILAEALVVGDTLRYDMHEGNDNTGDIVFTQTIPVTAPRAEGFDFIGWWTQPSEISDGYTVYVTITLTPFNGGDPRILLVRPVVGNANRHYIEVFYRTYEDVDAMDAMNLKNFQAAMVANQIPDVGNELPTITGVTFEPSVARVDIPLELHTNTTTSKFKILEFDNTTPDGTHLLLTWSISANATTASTLIGFQIGESLPTPLVFGAQGHFVVGATQMLQLTITVDMYVVGDTVHYRPTQSGFSATDSWDTIEPIVLPLTGTPMEIVAFFSHSVPAGDTGTMSAYTATDLT